MATQNISTAQDVIKKRLDMIYKAYNGIGDAMLDLKDELDDWEEKLQLGTGDANARRGNSTSAAAHDDNCDKAAEPLHVAEDSVPECLRHSSIAQAQEDALALHEFLSSILCTVAEDGDKYFPTGRDFSDGCVICFRLLRDKMKIGFGIADFPLTALCDDEAPRLCRWEKKD